MGYKLSKAQVKPAAAKGGPKVVFEKPLVMLDAAVNGQIDQVNDCLTDGVDIHASDADGMTALHRACMESYLNIASSLINKNADLTVADNDWWTPLHAAAHSGHWRICTLLLNNGADPLAVNAEGDLPIDLVGDTKVEGILSREMENQGVDIKDEDKINELRDAMKHKMLEDMKQAVADKADLNKKYQCGATWLHVAACNGFLEVVQFLMDQQSINPNIGDEDGNTPLHLAVQFQQYESVMYLVAKGADMRARNNLNQKPIILAEDQTMIRLLTALEKKVDASAAVQGGAKKKYTGSISRSSRANKGNKSRKDRQGEGSQAYSGSADG